MARGLEAEVVALDGLQLTQADVRPWLAHCCAAFFAFESRSLSAELAACEQMITIGSQCPWLRSCCRGPLVVPHALGLEMLHLWCDQNSDNWSSHAS